MDTYIELKSTFERKIDTQIVENTRMEEISRKDDENIPRLK